MNHQDMHHHHMMHQEMHRQSHEQRHILREMGENTGNMKQVSGKGTYRRPGSGRGISKAGLITLLFIGMTITATILVFLFL